MSAGSDPDRPAGTEHVPAAPPLPLLRSPVPRDRAIGAALLLVVGAGAAALVALGNPGNMGVCGACFLRDLGGALRMHAGPAILRPEVVGVVVGALVAVVARRRFVARSGSHAAARFLLGVLMSLAALVFLGCPFRLLQRLGGGDLNAWVALPGFVAGVGVGRFFEGRGYSVGRTEPAPAAVGLLGPLALAALLVAWLLGAGVAGPGPGVAGPPPHAPWSLSLGVAAVAGVLMSVTGFCAVSAARQVFAGPRGMLLGALALVVAYAAVAAATGRFSLSFSGQPLAHGDVLWNLLALALLGLAGALAGGCPVRQMVMAGEGNADAFVTVCGLVVGGALSHAWGTISAAASAAAAGGPTASGRAAVVAGLVVATAYAALVARARPAAAR